MSLIAKSTIDEVNNRLDAIAVAEEYVRLEKKGGRYWGLCPFHHEKTPSFTVDPEKKMYHCFGCGKGGGVIGFVMEMDKISYPEAIKVLARKLGIEIVYEDGGEGPERDWEAENTRKEELFELYRRTSVTFHHFLLEKPEGKAAFQYIVNRGINKDMIERFRLGYTPSDRYWLHKFLASKGYSADFLAGSGLFSQKHPQSAFFSGRLMFPIGDRQGKTAAFGARILEGEGPKYINSPDSLIYHKGETLYAIDIALPAIRQTKTVYIAEGYMDVIALHQAGIENTVAPLGTAFTGEQAKLLRRWAEKAVLVFDSDEAGQKAAYKGIITCRKNGLSCALTRPEQLEGAELKDPADILKNFGQEVLKKNMQCIITDFEYLISRGRSLYGMSAPEGKNRALALLFPYLEALDSEIERDDCIGTAADAFGVDREAVQKDYNRRRAGGRTGDKAVREEVSDNERPVRMNDELFLFTVVSVNQHLYPEIRKALEIREIEDPVAKELFVALEECFIHEESGIDLLLSRISSAPLRNFIVERGSSPEFRGDSKRDPRRLMEDGIKRIKEKSLRRRLAAISAELRMGERNAGLAAGSDLEDLLAEKMFIDAEIRRLERR
ncbi:MAG: DNA primase [Treponema sp.]|nr:DNA primase [Treponema sp.]